MISFNELAAHVKKLRDTEGVDSMLGTVVTTQGILVVLFSHRFNKDVLLFVSGTDAQRVSHKVADALERHEQERPI